MSKKITYKTPIVEMQGDEMTRILWDDIKDILINPFVDFKTEFYDLGLENREKTKDAVTTGAAKAIEKYGVGLKCATITPNAQRVKEYNLSNMWRSPNGTIRAYLDGTVFRTPIIVKGIKSFVPSWIKPITVARHAYGDMYANQEFLVTKGSKAELVVTSIDGTTQKALIKDFNSSNGIVQGIHNTDESITNFAKCCFLYALDLKQDLWFSAKDTISKIYDHRFKDIFDDVYNSEFKDKFKNAGISYEYTLVDDAIARVMRSSGGMVWACKNYDGDVFSDMVASSFGSLAMMTSVLVSPKGYFEYEAAHGTVTRHYYKHIKGEPTSTNSVATIFAFSGALKKRGELEKNKPLIDFANRLEKATLDTIEQGFMTGDLIGMFESPRITPTKLNSKDFLLKIADTARTL